MKRTKIRILTLVMAAILILGVCSVTLAALKFEVGQEVYVRSFKSVLETTDKDGKLKLVIPGAGKKVTILELLDGKYALVSMMKTYLAADGSLVEIETIGHIHLNNLVKEMPQPSGGGDAGCPNGLCGYSLAEHYRVELEGGIIDYSCPYVPD